MRKPKGFVLWEMLLALAIFCVVASALTSALEQTSETAGLIQDESIVRRELQNILVETTIQRLQTGKTDLSVGDGRIHYEREITKLARANEKGQPLPGLWLVTVRADWQVRNRARKSRAELTVYQP